MRISGIQNHPDHWRNVFRLCPAIILDDEWMHHVVTADDVAGTVEVVRYENGRPKTNGEYILTQVKRGRVQIIGPKIGDPIH